MIYTKRRPADACGDLRHDLLEPAHAGRRGFIRVAAAALGAAAVAPAAFAAGAVEKRVVAAAQPVILPAALPTLSPPPPSPIVAAAQAALARKGGLVAHRDVVAVADFARPSGDPRLHLVDLENGKVQSLLVAHGLGSDPGHSGWLRRFSNSFGSDATSAGAYLTSAYYEGKHGPSLRLKGLDASNSNAEAREIVVHSAWYVGPTVLRAKGMLGCSDGCFALSEADLPHVLHRLGPGRLIVATRL